VQVRGNSVEATEGKIDELREQVQECEDEMKRMREAQVDETEQMREQHLADLNSVTNKYENILVDKN
jgi:hypothetical protein